MAELTCAEKLAEARQAYHELNTGQSLRRWIDQNGEQMEYTMANRAGLQSYIRELEAECGTPPQPGIQSYRGPLRFTFGRRIV
jgi:hypothetical protein